MRNLIWFVAGAVALAVMVSGGDLVFLETGANGFSARVQPSALETFAARQARAMALPAGAPSYGYWCCWCCNASCPGFGVEHRIPSSPACWKRDLDCVGEFGSRKDTNRAPYKNEVVLEAL